MPRWLGIDHGTKRIGLAISDPQGRFASPHETLTAGDIPATSHRIMQIVEEFGVEGLVVGLPLNMDGTEGPQAKLVRRFGEALAAASGLPVEYHDERLSSFTAEENLMMTELTHKQKKARRDQLAARAMLQDFLDSRNSAS